LPHNFSLSLSLLRDFSLFPFPLHSFDALLFDALLILR
jgi:hypothetical protein